MVFLDLRRDRGVQADIGVTRRVRIRFSGTVQGVGFRPFIYTSAQRYALAGYVQNRSSGVVAEVEGEPESVDGFIDHIRGNLPVLAELTDIDIQQIRPVGHKAFQILPSISDSLAAVHISPDMATCDACLEEMFNPLDRRYRYPFINCTNCGPRLTITKSIPYDRCNTSMAGFDLCADCRKEYEDPENRRFHAQPNACRACGPRLVLCDGHGNEIKTDDILLKAAGHIREGDILAVKGLGGFHLCVDATNNNAVKRLREKKKRQSRPLAVMVSCMDRAREIARINYEEEELLLSPERPIVLLESLDEQILSPFIAPGMRHLGVMLPYTPLHHLIFASGFKALVMTSANRSDEPICIGNEEAFSRLGDIADYYLVHNRDIVMRCDDSIAFVEQDCPRITRRSRGFSPRPVSLNRPYPDVLSLGAHMKSSVCIIKGSDAFLSPHIGDMESPLARDFLHETISVMEHITQCSPSVVACDLHPAYYSSKVAASMSGRTVIPVQHHHAHIISAMAENMLSGDVIGLALDGTGYGDDGHAWGGEFLCCSATGYIRLGHVSYFQLPGGEKAVHEPWRTGAGLLRKAYGQLWRQYADSLDILPDNISCDLMDSIMDSGINTPLTSSMGRIFDGVASILGMRQYADFEGQSAMEIEAMADAGDQALFEYEIHDDEGIILDFSPMIRSLVGCRLQGRPAAWLSSVFHSTMIRALIDVASLMREKTALSRIVLSGGCFQNRLLLKGCIQALVRDGFEVFTNKTVPSNDGGIALGQAVCAAEMASRGLQAKSL